ncbi:MAG: VWA domain-containing protein [Pyrinomonadaceae bacterium]|nr:VWA domain-containing protein [Pyrinomonadaceae bacterium]
MAFIRNSLSQSLAVVCSLLLLSASVLGQTPEQQNVEQERASVNLNVIITDEANRAVTDVRREDVRLTEDGTTQTIEAFALEDRPVSYGLLIDTTGSLRALLNDVIETARAIVSTNRPNDEAFVMHYTDSDTIEVDQGWTTNRAALEEALDDIFIQGGLTATLDALHSALNYATRPRSTDGKELRRRAIVLITDGEDRGSRQSNPETLLSRLRETDVQIFVIGLTKIVKELRNRDKAAQLLTRIAQETGGRAFFPKSFAEMPDVLKELTRDLHTQYSISYRPTNNKRDGSFRKLQVTLAQGKGKRNAFTRAGYIAQ